MSTMVGDFLLQRLSEWGIRRIFAFPGDGITGIIAAFGRAGDRFDCVQREARAGQCRLDRREILLGGGLRREIDDGELEGWPVRVTIARPSLIEDRVSGLGVPGQNPNPNY
ncbi:MAG: hypothetical protein ACREC0_11265 [Methylocella sp.]